MMKIINGNILDAENCIVCQQVNHQRIMGAGLAKQIVEKYPGILKPYQEFCQRYSFNEIRKNGYVHFYIPLQNKQNIIIANIFGQEHIGYGKSMTDYYSLSNGLYRVKELAQCTLRLVAIPYKIGCGLAGGQWDAVCEILDDVFYDGDVGFYIFNYESELKGV